MDRKYEELKSARFSIESIGGVETIRIFARRNWLFLPFFSLWLVMWTIGGAGALATLFTRFDALLLLWLVMWALGWLFVASLVLWQIAGSEHLRLIGGDLEVGYSFPGFRTSRLYRGADIRSLSAATVSDVFAFLNATQPPFLLWRKSGTIRFNYGARTIRAAAALDEAEAEMIVDFLRRRLPASAVEPSTL